MADKEAGDDIPAELSTQLTACQQFEEQAKALLVGRAQPDNMVQLLSSQVEGKQPEQVTLEVRNYLNHVASATTIWLLSLRQLVSCYKGLFGNADRLPLIHSYRVGHTVAACLCVFQEYTACLSIDTGLPCHYCET